VPEAVQLVSLSIGRTSGTGIGSQVAFQPETSLQTATQVFHATHAQTAGQLTVGRHGRQAVAAGILDLTDAKVNDAEQGHRRLSGSGTCEGTQRSQSDQGFFHCNFLQS